MIALISDIHGNYVALKEVLRKIDELKIENIFCLGDVVGYYSQVNECCNELRRKDVKCVMGNHDWYMASDTLCDRSHSVNDCLDYQKKIISDENLAWIRSFPVYRYYKGLAMVHGGWKNPIDEYLNPSEEYFSNIKGELFASGHTHVQKVEKYGRKIYCNPGSVGQPRDGDNRSAFVTFDGTKFERYRLAYDIEKVGELMKQAGFHSYYYGSLTDASEHLHTI